jgi:transposase
MRRAYQSDLSDAEWSCLKTHLPAPEANGRPRLHSPREITDAIFYILKSGCAWRLLPHDFPTAGRPSITTSDNGVSTVPGRGSIGPSVNVLGFA